MAPTLASLLSAPGLGLRVLAGVSSDPAQRAAALRRPVTWVSVSELADPTPYLEGGELVLLTGLLADVVADADRYVARLVRADVAALGVGVGIVHEQVPAELIAAADAAGLPLLEVDRPTPFIAVGKALADLIALEQGERTRRRLDAMRSLTGRLAGDPASPRPALVRLAEVVDGWAALLDARARLIAVTGRAARPDVAQRLAGQLRGRFGHTSAADADSLGRVTVLPLGLRDRPYGFLAVGVGPGADLDHHLVAFAASLLTLDYEHARGTRPVRRWARAAALAGRSGQAPPSPPAAVLGPLARVGRDRPVRALVLARPLEAVLEALDDEDVVAGLPLEDAAALIVLADADTDDVLAAVTGSATTGSATSVTGGLSAPVSALDDLPNAVAEARSLAARARDGVLRAGTAPPSLLELLGPEAAAAFATAALAPVRRLPEGATLEESLRAYLVAHGALAVAAEALGVHRHTLRSRLRRVAAALGRDLDDPSTRAELWVALSEAARRI